MKNLTSALLMALLVLFIPLSSHADETQPAPIGDPIPLPPIDGEFMPAPDGGDPIPLPPIDGEYEPAPGGGDPIPLPPIDGEFMPAPDGGDPIKLPPLTEEDLVAEFEKERQGSNESATPLPTKTSTTVKDLGSTNTTTTRKNAFGEDAAVGTSTKVGLPSTGN